jgi:spore coat polysaccharide biosynthesis protein SpsF
MNKSDQLKIGIITQARMTSTRLPGKVLKEIKHKSLLKYHTQRLQQSGIDVIIATTSNETDNIVQQFAEKEQILFHRGDENNVLSRYHQAAVKFGLDVIIRVTSDCPLIDPHLIRNSLEKYLQFNNPQLYVSNGMERTFARGFDFEIFSFQLLDEAFKKATDAGDLEHVTPYIWKNRSGKVEFYPVKQPVDNSRFRITVDTPEDFELINILIEKYNADQLAYTAIEEILIAHPELSAINAHIEQKKV